MEFVGVSKIETDVSAKTVIVEADESVAPQMMLEKLEKVSERSETKRRRELVFPCRRLTLCFFVPLFLFSGAVQVGKQ
jgi:hypothetical protein